MKLLAHYTSSVRPNYGSISRQPIVIEDEDEKKAIISAKRYCIITVSAETKKIHK